MQMEQQIHEAVSFNKMDYELWAETAIDFKSLRKSLVQRGFRNVGFHEPVIAPEPSVQIVSKIPKQKIGPLSNRPKSMMKRGV